MVFGCPENASFKGPILKKSWGAAASPTCAPDLTTGFVSFPIDRKNEPCLWPVLLCSSIRNKETGIACNYYLSTSPLSIYVYMYMYIYINIISIIYLYIYLSIIYLSVIYLLISYIFLSLHLLSTTCYIQGECEIYETF